MLKTFEEARAATEAAKTSPEASGDVYWGWPTPKPQEECEKVFWFKACHCKKVAKTRGCNKLSCPGCAQHLRLRRKMSIRGRFEAARGNRPVLYTIFTVPKELREKAADPKVWRDWRRKLGAVLKKRFGMDFAVERTDPAGKCKASERSGESCVCPKCSRWHPHMNFLWVQKPTGRHRPFITPAQMAYLKRRWAFIIGREPGKPINIRHAYCKGDRDNDQDVRRLHHWYSYMARTWADWQKSVGKHLRINWYGAPKAEVKPEKECYCPDCKIDYVVWRTSDVEEAKYLQKLEPMALWCSISNRIIAERKHGRPRWGGGRRRKRGSGFIPEE